MRRTIQKIVLSSDIEAFKQEGVFDETLAANFPGALWIPALVKRLRSRGFEVTTGDVGLSRVKKGIWQAPDIGVIQHLDDPETEKLIELGANPLILTAFESPLYVPDFYNKVDSIAPKFLHRVLFTGLFDLYPRQNGRDHPLRFPSFKNADLKEPMPWAVRNFLVMVVENKYADFFSPLYLLHPLDILKLIKRYLGLLRSPKHFLALWNSSEFKGEKLHDKRLSAVIFFARHDLLRLYGRGWDHLDNLPRYYGDQLKSLFKRIGPQIADNKINTIMNFKFALCFENYAFPGYITEKIIDCIVAGVIPVYWGAPDIRDHVPAECFIDARQFGSWDLLLHKLRSITDVQAEKMINAGKNFLASSQGQMHTFDGFASFLESLVVHECQKFSTLAYEKDHADRTI